VPRSPTLVSRPCGSAATNRSACATDEDDPPAGRIHQAGGQRRDGGLARTGRADESHGRAGRNPKRHVGQHGRAGRVRKRNALELDVERLAATRAGRPVEGTGAVAHLAGRGQHIAYAIEPDSRPGQLTEHEADRADRNGEHAEQERDTDHLGQAHGALAQPYATDDEDGECAEARQRVEDRIEEPTDATDADHRCT